MMQNNPTNENTENNANEDISMYYPEDDGEHIARDDHDEAFLNETIKKKKKLRRKNGRLKKSQIALIMAIFVIYALVLVVAAWMIFYKPTSPNQEELPFEIEPMKPVETVVSDDPENPPLDNVTDNPTSPSENTPSGSEQPAETEEMPTVDEYVVKDGVYNILLLGHDDQALLADVTMLVNVNTNDNTITVMQIPRDTFVSLNILTNHVNAMFNSFYNQCYAGSYDATVPYAIKEVEKVYEKSLCINIHHTAVLSLAGFESIVNIMGGVGVYVPEAMYYTDPEQGLYISIGEGYQWLDGAAAEGFVRYRSGYVQADLGRVNAQKIFLTAFFDQFKNTLKSANVSKLTDIATEISKYLTTDMSISDMMFYAKALLKMDLSDINMLTIPGNLVGQYYVVNRAATLNVVNEYFNIYEKEITDSIFDRSGTFNLYSDPWISEYYYAGSDYVYDDHVYNGESVNNESIHIPRT